MAFWVQIGDARAQEVFATLKRIVGPVVDDAEADLRQHANPATEVVWSASPASYLARCRSGPEMRSRCVGVVYEDHAGDAEQDSIQLGRDGVLRWRRD